jgi:hypothetical protein
VLGEEFLEQHVLGIGRVDIDVRVEGRTVHGSL